MLSAELHTTLLMFVAEVQCLRKGPQVRTDEMVRIWAKFFSIGLILIEGDTVSCAGKQLAAWGECFGDALESNTINAWTII